MTDHRIQSAARAATESVEDAAILLRLRVRSGELDGGRVRLAAFCGDEAAQLASEDGMVQFLAYVMRDHDPNVWKVDEVLSTWLRDKPLEKIPSRLWFRGLESWGNPPLPTAALAAAREARAEQLREEGNPHADGSGCPGGRLCSDLCSARDALVYAAKWVADPRDENFWGLVTRFQQETSPDDWMWWFGLVVAHVQTGTGAWPATRELLDRTCRMVGHDAIRLVVQKALIAWALRTVEA